MWISCFLILLISLDAMDLATAKDLCKTEVSVLGKALKGFVYKKVTVTAPYECDITCKGETKCQSFNYVIGEKSCAREFPVRRFTLLQGTLHWQK